MELNLIAFFHIFIAVLFIVSAIAKLSDRYSFQLTLERLSISRRSSSWLSVTVPWCELVVACLFVLNPVPILTYVSFIGLLAAFTWAIWRARGMDVDCGCFGSLSQEKLGRLTGLRVLLLLGMGMYLIWKLEPIAVLRLSFNELHTGIFLSLGLIILYILLIALYYDRFRAGNKQA